MAKNNAKLGLGVVALIGVLVAWNFIGNNAVSAFRPKKKPKPIDTSSPGAKHGAKLPKSLGPAKAPVTIRIFLNGSNTCHTPSLDLLKKIVATYPKEVRVEVLDTRDPKNKAAANKAKIGCETGLSINGKSVFRVPGQGIVTFTGALKEGHFSTRDLDVVLDHLILKKTGKPAVHAKVPASDVAKASGPPAPPGPLSHAD